MRILQRLTFFTHVALHLMIWPSFGFAKNFDHDGIQRKYALYLPKNLKPGAPLVFALHGYGSNPALLRWYSGFDRLADKHGFAVVYPTGSLDRRNTRHWNANLMISETDDIGFLTALAGHLQKTHQLNPKRTFVAGMSNGGFMGFTLACEAPDVFRAIASVTGTMSGFDWHHCKSAQPLPVLAIHGVEDQVVPIDGSMTTAGGWGGAPPLARVIEFWQKRNKTSRSVVNQLPPNTTATYHQDGTGGAEVWFYRIENWGHLWPGKWNKTGTNASDVIWQFFSRF